jgi:type I restriction enzyme S subunit
VEALASNQQINAILPNALISSEFLYYASLAFASRVKEQAGEQAVPMVNKSQFAKTRFPLPPTKAEQEAIAGALSDADAWIASLEQLIAKKRRIKEGSMQALLTAPPSQMENRKWRMENGNATEPPPDSQFSRRLPGFSGEWEVRTLGELGKCHRGVSYSPYDLSSHETNSTVRLLRSNNVQNSSIVFSDMQYVDSSRVSEHQHLREKDVLICMANGSRQLVGKAGQFYNCDGNKYTFGAFMGAFRPDPTAANADFVFMIFSTEAYRHHIDLLLAGSSINNLRPSSVEELQLLIPDLEEQAAIATVLSEMDAEIEALEAKLAKARQIKQGMMQELLTGRTRLENGEWIMENGEWRMENG